MVAEDIIGLVKEGIPRVLAEKREWLLAHLCEPKEITVYSNEDRQTQMYVWAVTDHTGADNDGIYRVVYDPSSNCFGLEMSSEDGTPWFMGAYSEDFAATVNMIS